MTPLRRLARPLAVVAVVLALGALLVVSGARSGGAEAPALPAYTATGEARRGAGADVLVRPSSSIGSKVAAWPFSVADGEDEPSPLEAKVEVAKDGVVHLRAPGAALARIREIRVVVAAAGATKFDDALARARAGTSDDRMRVVTVRVDR